MTSLRDVRVCFVGDSFVAGRGDSSGLGWVGRIAAESYRREQPLTSYNLGVRGDTSLLVSERIAREIEPRLVQAQDPRVVVSYGVNDVVLDGGAPRVELIESVGALRRIQSAIGGIPLAFVGPPAMDDPELNERVGTLNAALRHEAAALGIRFIDCFDAVQNNELWWREVRAGDGAHPDAAGYGALASFIQEPLFDWLS